MPEIFSSYSKKLVVFVLVLSLIPSFAIGGYLIFDKINSETENMIHTLSSISEFGAFQVSHEIEDRKNITLHIGDEDIVVAATKKLTDSSTSKSELFQAQITIQEEFADAFERYSWLQELVISDPNTGDVLMFTGLSYPMTSLKDEKHYQDALEGKIGISDIYPSVEIIRNEYGNYEKGVPTLLISTPISGEVGLEGVLTARANIFDIAPDMTTYLDMFSISDAYFVNSDGYFLSKSAFPTTIREMGLIEKRPQLELRLIDPVSKELINIFLDAKTDRTVSNLDGYDNYQGNSVVGSITSIKETNWNYVVEIDRIEAFKKITQFQIFLTSGVSLIILSLIGITLHFSASLTTPILILKKATEKVSAGNFDVTIPISGKDEIHDLAVSFKSMLNSLKKSRNVILDAEAKFRNLYENSPALHRTIDINGIILNCNDSYAKRFGYSKEEVIGSSIFKFVSDDNKDGLRKSFETWKEHGTVYNREIWFKTKNGKTFPALISANNLYDKEGKLIGSNTIIREITDFYNAKKEKDEKELAQATIVELKKIEKMKDEFSSIVSHELLTPLVPIKGSCNLLLGEKGSESLNDESKYLVKMISKNIERLESLIKRILLIQRLEMHKMKWDMQEFNPKKLLDDVLYSNSFLMEDKKISFTNSAKEDFSIYGDPKIIHEIFDNLIQNAVDFVPEKNGRIEIGATQQDHNAVFNVKDNGCGIPKEKQKHLFDMFYQVDSSDTREHGGIGVGLGISKKLVEGMEGKIWCDSDKGKGSTFYFSIPIVKKIKN